MGRVPDVPPWEWTEETSRMYELRIASLRKRTAIVCAAGLAVLLLVVIGGF
jgi:hypothetical protein